MGSLVTKKRTTTQLYDWLGVLPRLTRKLERVETSDKAYVMQTDMEYTGRSVHVAEQHFHTSFT